MNSNTESKWLVRLEDVDTASNASLRRSLLTADGRGVELKTAALNQLIARAMHAGMMISEEVDVPWSKLDSF